jgi:hypothetical protein
MEREPTLLKTIRTEDGTYLHKVIYPVKEDARRRSQAEPEFKWIKDSDLTDPALIRQAEMGRIRLRAAERQIESDESDGWGASSDDGSEDSRSSNPLSEREGSGEEREEGEGEGEGEGPDDRSANLNERGGTEPPAKRRRSADDWGPAEACPDLGAGWMVQVRSGGRKVYLSPEGGCFSSKKKAQDYVHTKADAGQSSNALAVRPEFPQARRCGFLFSTSHTFLDTTHCRGLRHAAAGSVRCLPRPPLC